MMRKIIYLFLILNLISLSPILAETQRKVYNIPLFQESRILNLPLNKISHWFYISPGIEVLDTCYINLYYSFSESLIEKESFLVLFVNRTPLTTKKIVDKTQIPINMKVKIPRYLIKSGFNEITISTRQRSIEGLCKDLDNDANWIILHNNSLLHLETIDKPFSIKYYPYPFLDKLAINPVNFKFYLPKDPSEEELMILFSLANNLGTKERFKHLSYKVSLENPDDATNENQIIIGDIQKWQELIKAPFYNELEEKDGLIYAKKDKENLKLYISGKGEGILKALSYLLNPEQISLTEKNPVIIKSQYIESEEIKEGKKRIIRLKDLGYNPLTISGAYHQSASLYIKAPIGFESLQEGSFIEIKFSHSPNLDPEKSIITLYIDGNPVKGEKLDGKNRENGILRVNIPKDKLKQKEWTIDIKVYHSINNADCDKRFDEVAWTRIDGDSLIYLIGGYQAEYPNLRNLWRGDIKDIYIWLPEKPSPYELSLLSTIVGKIGQNTGNTYPWKVIVGNNIDVNSIKDKIIIFLGSFKDERIEKISKNLWLKPEGEKFISKRDLGIYFDGFNTDAIFQAEYSPFGKNGVLYTILYNDESSLIKLNNLFDKLDSINNIYGQVSIMTKLGTIKSFVLFEKKTSWTNILEIKPLIFYVGILVIVILITFITIYYSKRRRNI